MLLIVLRCCHHYYVVTTGFQSEWNFAQRRPRGLRAVGARRPRRRSPDSRTSWTTRQRCSVADASEVRARCLQPPTRCRCTALRCAARAADAAQLNSKKDSFSKQLQPSVNIRANRRPVFFDKSEPKSLNGCFNFPAIFLGLFWSAVSYAAVYKLSWSPQFEKKSGKSEKVLGKIWKSWKKMVKVVIRSWYGWMCQAMLRTISNSGALVNLFQVSFSFL